MNKLKYEKLERDRRKKERCKLRTNESKVENMEERGQRE